MNCRTVVIKGNLVNQSQTIVVALVGNKSDIIEREEVSYEEARAYAKQI